VVGWARGNHTDVGDDHGDELDGYIATQERMAAWLVERRYLGRSEDAGDQESIATLTAIDREAAADSVGGP
jgi:hypothetical protein